MNKSILFHVGLHKTGTSSLQQDFFVPRNGFMQHEEGRGFCSPIFINKFSTQQLSAEDRRILDDFAQTAHGSNCLPVVSHERLSGYPISGGYDRLSIYNRIASLDYDIKILFVMREQKSWLYSAWRQMISDGGSIGLSNFVSEAPITTNARMPGPRFEYLNYAQEIDTLSSLFGRENVLVFPFELIKSDFSMFAERLAVLSNNNAIVIPEEKLSHRNARRKLSSFYSASFVNRFLVSSETAPRGLVSGNTKLGKQIRSSCRKAAKLLPEIPLSDLIIKRHKEIISRHVGSYFVESNKRCAELIDIDLGALGYDV